MNFIKLQIGILIAFVAGAILVAGILLYVFRKRKTIDLVQGKLVNLDGSDNEVISYLKLTNEWSSDSMNMN